MEAKEKTNKYRVQILFFLGEMFSDNEDINTFKFENLYNESELNSFLEAYDWSIQRHREMIVGVIDQCKEEEDLKKVKNKLK